MAFFLNKICIVIKYYYIYIINEHYMNKKQKQIELLHLWVLLALLASALIIATVKLITMETPDYKTDGYESEEMIKRAKIIELVDYNKNWD